MIKLMKKKRNIQNKYTAIVRNGAAFDRLAFFILILLLMSHFAGCLMIFVGNSFKDSERKNDSWIDASGFSDMGMMDLYSASVYFVM